MPEEGLRKNAENEKINREGDQNCPEKARPAKGVDEQFRQEEQAENVREVGDEQNGDEKALGPFDEPIEPQGRPASLFHMVAQPHRVDREQTRFDAREEKRDRPEQENREAVNHGPVAPLSSCSGSRQAVFSRRISSIRFRPARRTVMASRGISKRVPEGGK